MLHNDIASLSEKAQPIFLDFLQKLLDAGISVKVLETLRDQDVQVAYYAQGRQPLDIVNKLRAQCKLEPISITDNAKTITNCDGVKVWSNHQSGNAADIVPIDSKGKICWNAPMQSWLKIAVVGEKLGLKWGGRFGQKSASTLGWDCPHWEVS